jgi:hypothetical protein
VGFEAPTRSCEEGGSIQGGIPTEGAGRDVLEKGTEWLQGAVVGLKSWHQESMY